MLGLCTYATLFAILLMTILSKKPPVSLIPLLVLSSDINGGVGGIFQACLAEGLREQFNKPSLYLFPTASEQVAGYIRSFC